MKSDDILRLIRNRLNLIEKKYLEKMNMIDNIDD